MEYEDQQSKNKMPAEGKRGSIVTSRVISVEKSVSFESVECLIIMLLAVAPSGVRCG